MTLTGSLRFQPRTAKYIARRYRNSAVALKELVANAWDADATRVDISLPLFLEGQPVVVIDNGHGMTARELQSVYLPIGANRLVRGPTTKSGRTVKGRLGFGKLAGFQFASKMTVRTVARGRESCLVLDEADLDAIDASGKDIKSLRIPILTGATTSIPGTTIELSQLRPGLEQPDPSLLRAVLLREFGLPNDFQIFIDGQRLVADDIEGEKIELQLGLSDGTTPQITIRFLPTSGAVANTGLALRVDGRALDRPPDFGLRDDPDVPRGALRRAYIEVVDNGLRDDVTADWTGVVEDSERFQELQNAVKPLIKEQLLRRLESDAPETEEQFVERWERQEQLELLPFTQRERLLQALRRVFSRYFSENQERRDIAANLVVDIFRQEPYWLIARRLDEIKPRDLVALAEVLSEWGFGNLAEVSAKAMARLRFLDEFTKLILSRETGEFWGVHPVLRSNPWLFGDEYELMVSNRQINTIVKKFSDDFYKGSGGTDRPDLIMMDSNDRLLLVELKSPQDTLDWDNEAQAKKYRDRLAPSFPGKAFSVVVLGGSSPPEMVRNAEPGIKLSSYKRLVVDAETRLRWLIANIDVESRPLPDRQTNLGI